MTKKEFVEKFHLVKTITKCSFNDGFSHKERTLYTDKYGRLFCFYNHDLYAVKPYEEYISGMEWLGCKLGAGYSWYN